MSCFKLLKNLCNCIFGAISPISGQKTLNAISPISEQKTLNPIDGFLMQFTMDYVTQYHFYIIQQLSIWERHRLIGGIFLIFGKKIFFEETARPIELKLGMEVHRSDLTKVCSNCGEICVIVFLRQFSLFLVKKSSSLKPQVRLI